MTREMKITAADELIREYLNRGGCINVLKARVPKYRPRKYMPVASKRQTYGHAYDKPAGYRGVNYEQVGNNASGYSTKYVINKEIA
jgi:hypothetical protein